MVWLMVDWAMVAPVLKMVLAPAVDSNVALEAKVDSIVLEAWLDARVDSKCSCS